MSKKILSESDRKLLDARLHAAKKLQHLCFDAAQGEKTAFMNRDRALEVVDAISTVVLETLSQYLKEDNNAAANAN